MVCVPGAQPLPGSPRARARVLLAAPLPSLPLLARRLPPPGAGAGMLSSPGGVKRGAEAVGWRRGAGNARDGLRGEWPDERRPVPPPRNPGGRTGRSPASPPARPLPPSDTASFCPLTFPSPTTRTPLHRYAESNARLDYRFDPKQVASVKARFLTLANVVCIRDFMSGWFHGAPPESIRRGNVEDFVAYGFYTATKAELPREQRDAIEAFVRELERRWGVTFPPGRNPALRFMAHLWEPLRVIHKPLALHAACEVGVVATRALLWAVGFRREEVAGFEYWVRDGKDAAGTVVRASAPFSTTTASPAASPASSSASDSDDAGSHRGDSFSSLAAAAAADRRPRGLAPGPPADPSRPVVFIHGVGLGLVPYLGLLAQVAAALPRRTPLALLEVPHVSLRLAPRRASPVDDVASAAVAMLDREGWADAVFAAHSYGTFCVSRVCQRARHRVAAALLIDPVCFLTCYPHLLFNFVYKVPDLLAVLRGAAGALGLARFLFSRDLTIAETFCRRFLWHELMLWPDDMPSRTVVALSHDDDLVPSPLVAAHLAHASPSTRVLYHPHRRPRRHAAGPALPAHHGGRPGGHGGLRAGAEWSHDADRGRQRRRRGRAPRRPRSTLPPPPPSRPWPCLAVRLPRAAWRRARGGGGARCRGVDVKDHTRARRCVFFLPHRRPPPPKPSNKELTPPPLVRVFPSIPHLPPPTQRKNDSLIVPRCVVCGGLAARQELGRRGITSPSSPPPPLVLASPPHDLRAAFVCVCAPRARPGGQAALTP